MKPKRCMGMAAVRASGVCAGTIDSRKGSAIVTPAPCKNVLRDKCFFVMNITITLSFYWLRSFLHLLKRRALDDAQNQRGKTIICASGFLDDRSDGRHVVVFETAPETVGHEHFCHGADKLLGMTQNHLP